MSEPREVRKCPLCGYYWTRKYNVSCTVMHPPGQCCHYGEVRVEASDDEQRAERRDRIRQAAR